MHALMMVVLSLWVLWSKNEAKLEFYEVKIEAETKTGARRNETSAWWWLVQLLCVFLMTGHLSRANPSENLFSARSNPHAGWLARHHEGPRRRSTGRYWNPGPRDVSAVYQQPQLYHPCRDGSQHWSCDVRSPEAGQGSGSGWWVARSISQHCGSYQIHSDAVIWW